MVHSVARKKTEEETEETNAYVTLRVHRSRIPVGGRVRIHQDVLAHLYGPECMEMDGDEAEQVCDMIIVVNGDNRILVKAFWDKLMMRDVISLRPPDLEKLGVDEDAEVVVYLHKPRLWKKPRKKATPSDGGLNTTPPS